MHSGLMRSTTVARGACCARLHSHSDDAAVLACLRLSTGHETVRGRRALILIVHLYDGCAVAAARVKGKLLFGKLAL